MGETYLNGRPAAGFELPAIARARECERARDLALLAGVLTGQAPRVVPQGLDLPAIGAEIRQRRTDRQHQPPGPVVSECLCEFVGLPCECRRAPGLPRAQPHGTLAAARRHYRHEGPGWRCRSCRQAEQRANQDRSRTPRIRPAPSAADLAAGRAIREMRHAAGMTQRDLAAALGTVQSNVSGWEQGKYGSGPDLLARVAAATGAPAAEVPRAA